MMVLGRWWVGLVLATIGLAGRPAIANDGDDSPPPEASWHPRFGLVGIVGLGAASGSDVGFVAGGRIEIEYVRTGQDSKRDHGLDFYVKILGFDGLVVGAGAGYVFSSGGLGVVPSVGLYSRFADDTRGTTLGLFAGRHATGEDLGVTEMVGLRVDVDIPFDDPSRRAVAVTAALDVLGIVRVFAVAGPPNLGALHRPRSRHAAR